MLGKSLDQRKETSLSIEPSVGSELLLEWLKTLDDSTNTEVIVALGAVEGTDNKVNDTKMESLFGRLLDSNSIFLLLDTLHKFLSIGILTCHNVGYTEVGKNDCSDAQEIVHLSSDEWLVVSDGISVFVVLHEEDVGDIEFPGLMFATEFGRLSEYLLNLGIVSFVPINFCLHHEDWDVLVQGLIVFLEGSCDGFRVSGDSCILNRLGFLSQHVDMVVSQHFKLGVCLLLRRLVEDERFKKFEVLSGQTLVSQIRVFSQNIGSKVIMLILAVQQNEIWECFWRERWIVKEEVQLLEAGGGVIFDVHQSLVVEGDWVELFLVSWGHVEKSLFGGRGILH